MQQGASRPGSRHRNWQRERATRILRAMSSQSSNAAAPAPAPRVITANGRRTLEFTEGEIQSEMLLDRPNALVLEYTRAMMMFTLFQPQPRHIIIVGLGGGSLVKFCYHQFAQARITVLEVRHDVIALRRQFMVPEDDLRLRVLHADASVWLTNTREMADVILLDGFDNSGLPPVLASSPFYQSCRERLRSGGVLVANLFSYDPDYVAALQRLRSCFFGRTVRPRAIAGNNEIIFAVRANDVANPGLAEQLVNWMSGPAGFGWGWSNRLLANILVHQLGRTNR